MVEYVGRAVRIGLAAVLPGCSGDPTEEMIMPITHLISSLVLDKFDSQLASLTPAILR